MMTENKDVWAERRTKQKKALDERRSREGEQRPWEVINRSQTYPTGLVRREGKVERKVRRMADGTFKTLERRRVAQLQEVDDGKK
jgi:hypothetical protein